LIGEKIKRAKKHFADLENELREFNMSKPYEFSVKRDPETRKPVYYIATVQETPPSIAPIVGDIIQNLRSSLDHLAYALVEVNGFVDANGVPLRPRKSETSLSLFWMWTPPLNTKPDVSPK
jgi:hypothetical protein